ncbi:hypothetical protein [Kribbella sp. NPDC051770]|uniref:DUF1700 domain-containing protein n=1 Tax=Kribbella sp. NPDC051770 TaxID=3155413 RepID=UPI003440E0FC
MNSTLTGTIATYLAQVKAELSDLPPGELEDVLDDVASHLTEVAAEFQQEPTEGQLWERLGTPRQYADQLRTAAGYPASSRPPELNKSAAEKALRWGIIAGTAGPFLVLVGLLTSSPGPAGFFGLIGLAVLFAAAFLGVRALGNNSPRAVLDTPRGAQGAEFVRGLIAQIPPNVRTELVSVGQPVWWVFRGAMGGGGFFALFGAGAVAVVGAIAGAGVSIWIGRRSQQDRRWLWYVVPLNVIAILAVPAALAGSFVGASNGLFSLRTYDDRSGGPSYQNGLVLDGEPINNLYPFDEQGRQVSVRLYTENGQPLNLPLSDCANTYGRGGSTVSNLYPQAVIEPDSPTGEYNPDTGEEMGCKDSTKAPFVPPPAPATPTAPTPTPTGPTGGPSANPTPTPNPTSGTAKPTPTPSAKPSTGVTLTVPPPTR